MESTKDKLKKQIIEQLNLENISPDDIKDDAPLFADGLGLDSIDALELIVLMEKHYGVRILNPDDGKEIFKSINSMADYISKVKSTAKYKSG
ncbi:MAG: acyl carrier protein [Bacteroidia bacterium]|nr:acyl carrier protein [Bacteroidia bacterium]